MGFGGKSTFSKSEEEIEQFSQTLQNDQQIVDKLINKHGLTSETLIAYKVGVARYQNINPSLSNSKDFLARKSGGEELCITFPRTSPEFDRGLSDALKSKIVRVKACSVNDGELVAFDPPAFCPGLFGYHLAKLENETIIITGNEYDAMAAYQETSIPATCLPNQANQLPMQVLPLLERFSRIYIWLDDDVNGQDSAEKFADKLGIDRCLIVKTRCGGFTGPINAHEALEQGKDLKEILAQAKPLQHEQILDFESMKDSVFREISNPEQVRGILSKDLPALNKVMKGHRLGELTVFTGPTGTGKTTILSQLSLDYCKSGVSTLWGSFEIPNVRLAKRMLTQYAEKDLSSCPEEFSEWAIKFQQLPMYFLKFFGSTEVSNVIDAMNHAIHAFDVQHIIIDNLQFMTSEQGRFFDRFEIQERAISAFRKFATERNVHITLVVHPRKDNRELLDVNSIFGSAKVTQEADNVIIIQRLETEEGEERYLHIKKNRYDGTLGAIPYEFVKEALKIRPIKTRNKPPPSAPIIQKDNYNGSHQKDGYDPAATYKRNIPMEPPESAHRVNLMM
ncbi:16641_t:CDS:2 [Acaulospora colombiana]|uniref:16641_t:CDS:1 n=1 Tax=Acaulospora colombiana TaxID=27376 RepID=A0ACA9JXX4_9GLOM|nr:16641_t:CDS:2 [Acaulospora colombiana]